VTALLIKLSISIKIHVASPLCSVSKLLTESVSSRRELVANCVQTADADAVGDVYWVLILDKLCVNSWHTFDDIVV